jgi:diguanylate cyclase (GGDEF)-like protein
LLNHRRDPLGELISMLRRSGFEVTESRDLVESRQLVEQSEPTVVVANPLVVRRGGVEFELLEQLQRPDRPVPVILLVDDLEGLEQARHLEVPLRDFVMQPRSLDECLHRIELAAAARDHVLSLHERARELEGQVVNDFKTELLSERHFRSVLHVEFKRAQRSRAPLSLLLIDVDNFKGINDTTDYAFGDEVLREVAKNLKRSCRETDFAARFGGDEFVLLLPGTNAAEAVQAAMRVRRRIAESTIRSPRYETRVTISIGIDTYDGVTDSTPEELRRRANKALQQAKRRGKNQAWLYSNGEDDDRVAGASR